MAETANEPVNFDEGHTWGAEAIPMAHPFILGGVLYASIEMRAPTGYDVEKLFTQQSVSTPEFMKSLSGWPADAWHKMHGDDYRAAFKKVAAFLS